MAIYRKGQASMDADGYITGYGTNWKTALTLIRPGATIVFATNPVAYATISEIINDTSLRATSTGGAVVPQSDYVILLHDSITVDGLAQDVAETLRYYQGQETMYQEFVGFLKTFDWEKLEAIDAGVKDNAAAAAGSAANALQSEQNAFAHSQNASASAGAAAASESAAGQSAQTAHVSESNANAYREAAENSANSAAAHDQAALASKNAAAASEANALQSERNAFEHSQNASESASASAASESAAKQSETNAAASAAASDASKNESQAAAVISTNASNAASASKDAAAQSAASAKSDADRAADLADQLDATNLMRKDANLSDVADRRSAVNNLGLGWIDNDDSNSLLSSPDLSHRLVLGNDGLFVWQTSDGHTIPIAIASGGTGASDVAGARNNFGLGEDQAVTFSQITSKQWNGSNGGILISDNLNSSGERVSQSRFYSEVQGGICKTTIHTPGNGKNAYLQYDENGNLTGINDIYAGSVSCTKSISCAGWISANQGGRVGLTTHDGGNKDIFLQNMPGDGNVGSWVNLLQGNWYNGYWQLGAIRGGGSDISSVRLGVNNSGSDWKWFDFNNSYGGHITALRGFKGQCVSAAWTIDSEYMGAPFYADTATNNDGGYSPVVAGGTRASTGYDIRYSFGAMSGGAGDWSRAAIHMLGDATHHRAFEFFVDGRIYTWDNDNQWGGAFEFQRVANSDRDLKKDIEYNDGKASYDNIMKFKPSTFVYKSDKYNRLRRGVIAQDLCEIDPEYVRIIPGSPIIDNDAGDDEEGKPVIMDYNDDTLGLDNNVIMIDTALATRYIGGIVEKQQEEIDNLKAEVEELKAMISKLIDK
nr:MAG TPA: tail protein [Caudoviricetes sp.]